MSTTNPCIEDQVLKDYISGSMSPEEASSLEEHLLTCDRCTYSLNTIADKETVIEMIHARQTVTDEQGKALIDKLTKRLKARLPVREGGGVDTTLPTPERSSREGEMVMPAMHTEIVFDFLAPAEQPGCLGRLGPYRVLKVLGTGGMGIVLEAEETSLGRRVALKVMKKEMAEVVASRERFFREARVTASLEHDNVVTVFQVGEDHTTPWLAMQLLHGESLDDRLSRGEALELSESLRIGRETALGLAAAHEKGLIHRDIKPSNLWLDSTANDRVKILDFGLARSNDPKDAQITHSGTIIGTPAFMAPEQARGEPADARSDVFSLGCVLYRLVSGQLPFQGRDGIATLLAVTNDDPIPLQELSPNVPVALAELILQMLNKRAEGRPPTAQEVADRLAAIEQGQSPILSDEPEANTAPSQSSRWLGRPMAIALAVLLIGLGVIYGGAILRFATNKGQLIVETNDPSIEVVVRKGNVVVLDKTTKRTLTLSAGEYDIEVRGSNGLKFRTKQFSITRGGRKVLNVAHEVAARKDEKPLPDGGKTIHLDQEKPFTLVRGEKSQNYRHLSGALAVMQKGDRIVVHGNGPFPLEPLTLRGKGIDIRAGAGYRPRFTYVAPELQGGAKVKALMDLQDAPLHFEGCDVEFISDRALFVGGQQHRWTIRNCRFLLSDGYDSTGYRSLCSYAGPKLTLTNCLLAGGWTHCIALGADAEAHLENNVIATGLTRTSLITTGAGGQSIVLKNNTFVGWAVIDGSPQNTVQVQAAGNFFHVRMVFEQAFLATFNVKWKGGDNLYAGCVQEVHDKKNGKLLGKGLLALRKLPDLTQENVTEVKPLQHFHWDFARALPMEQAVKELQQITDAAKEKHQMKVLGPDWNLVGSGDAYVRGLAAEGKTVKKDQLRPDADQGGPFLILRKGKALRGHTSLEAAVKLSQNGDVIEIRGDGPFPGARVENRDITLRAAPGYRPTLTGESNPVLFVIGKTELVLEGLHLRGNVANYGEGRIAEMRNCSLDGSMTDLNGADHSVGFDYRFLSTFAPREGSPALIVNCFLPGSVLSSCPSMGKLILRNSVVGALAHHLREEKKPHYLELDRVVIWNPGATYQWLGGRGRGALEITAKHCLLENGTGEHFGMPSVSGHDSITKWTGSGNLYRIGMRRWLSPESKKTILGLAQWQKLWSSDTDSKAGTPLGYDAREWRLLPTSAGFKGGPGKDVGANVLLIGAVKPGAKEKTAR